MKALKIFSAAVALLGMAGVAPAQSAGGGAAAPTGTAGFAPTPRLGWPSDLSDDRPAHGQWHGTSRRRLFGGRNGQRLFRDLPGG